MASPCSRLSSQEQELLDYVLAGATCLWQLSRHMVDVAKTNRVHDLIGFARPKRRAVDPFHRSPASALFSG